MLRTRLISLVSAAVIAAACGSAVAQVGTAITYQGQLKNSGNAVNSATDMEFSLWTAASGGSQVGSTVTSLAVSVTQGLFTVPIDFGVNPYTADQALWLQIAVRNPAGAGAYIPMGSRQRLSAAPFSAATRGLNVNGGKRVGILTDPYFSDEVCLTLGSAGGADPAASILFDNRAGGGDWEAGAFDNASTYGDFTINRKNLDFPFIIRGDSGNVLLNAQSGGKVGIGTLTPSANLEVTGGNPTVGQPTAVLSGPSGALLSSRSTTGGFGGWDVYMANNAYTIGRFGIDFPFFISAASGNVGVGTDTPSAKLSVTGGDPNVGTPTAVLSGPAGALLSSRSTTGGFAGWDVYMANNGYTISRFGIDFPFFISATSGNIGIGTSTPSSNARLHVRQASNNNGIIRIDSGLSAAQYSVVGFADRGTQIWSAGLRPDGMFGIDRDGINTFLQIDQVGRIGMGGAVPTVGRAINVAGGAFCTGSVWTNACDENLKEGFSEVDPEQVLEKVAEMPISVWSYKGTQHVHMGPTAQDFHAAFGLGENDTSIGTVDADGVALAAIKGLNAKLQSKDAVIETLQARLEKIEAMLAAQSSNASK